MKKAFTLIELLVVIAIIAILAAILFPVFAQAKAAAKRTASLSNIKQLATSSFIYMSDSDDIVPLMTSWGDPGINNGAFVYFGNRGCLPWTQLLQPYTKNVDLFLDPQAGPFAATPTGFNPQIYKMMGTNYGYNPYLVQSATGVLHQTRNATAISRPADVVMFAQKYSTSEHTSNNFWGGFWFGAGTYFITLSIDPPDCGTNTLYCAAGYNNNGYYGGTGGNQVLRNIEANGAWTGGASLRGRQIANVAFADGHAGGKAPGWLAEGTTFNGARGANGIPTQTDAQITLVNPAIEHWYGNQ
jgi:prepilin-type N-terminal cleavage/methylation domain-containing protein/prepilin-type processing-associated H-X9-DG protein